jgi:hypothetical protein
MSYVRYPPVSGGGGGGAVWGAITGTLSAQTDLQAALNAKLTQGGDSFGAAVVVGSNDSNELQFKTNNVIHLRLQVSSAAILSPPDQTGTGRAAQFLAGTSTTGVGGALTLRAGAGATGFAGGGFTITGGTGSGATTSSSTLQGGVNTGAAGLGGLLIVQGGTTTGGGTGGDLRLRAGYGTSGGGASGVITMRTGTGVSGTEVIQINASQETVFQQLTADRVPYINATKAIKSSTVTQAELELLAGKTVIGDMTKAVYDTNNLSTDIFDYATAMAVALG